MGVLVSLADARLRRTERAERTSRHPALRWTVDGLLAHRLAEADRTVCGVGGQLTRANTEVALCGRCYPPRAAAGQR